MSEVSIVATLISSPDVVFMTSAHIDKLVKAVHATGWCVLAENSAE